MMVLPQDNLAHSAPPSVFHKRPTVETFGSCWLWCCWCWWRGWWCWWWRCQWRRWRWWWWLSDGYGMKPERSIGVCADLIVEIEQRMKLLVLKDRSKKILQKATSAYPSLIGTLIIFHNFFGNFAVNLFCIIFQHFDLFWHLLHQHHPLTSSFCFASVKQWMSSRLSSTNPT